ncbi:MAG: lysophospholipid acyltransferase family protein [Pikeienuella sp.]
MSRPAGQAYVHTRARWRVRAREWMSYALAYGFRVVTWPIGVWTLSGLLAPLGGWAALAVPGFRRRALRNLALVRPDLDPHARRAVTAEAGRQFLRLMIEYAHLDRWARGVDITAKGIETLRDAHDRGRGVVVVSAHYGNWEAVRLAALRAGLEIGIIYRAFNNRYLDRFALGLIPCCGTPVLHKGPAGLRELIGHVRRGGAVLILVDQRNTGAPFLPFLGHPAETVLAPAEIAARTGAALIPAMARRDPVGRKFKVWFEPPIENADARAAMTRVNARIGAWITDEPGQWLWFHRRWRATSRSRAQPTR